MLKNFPPSHDISHFSKQKRRLILYVILAEKNSVKNI